MKYKKIIFRVLLCLFYFSSNATLAEEKVLIIIASDNIEEMNVETISNLYSFRQKFIANSLRVKLTYLPINSEDTVAFTQKVFNYYPYQLKRIWDRAVFSGKASPPKPFDQAEPLLASIKKHDNFIGYLYINVSQLSELKEKYNVIATID